MSAPACIRSVDTDHETGAVLMVNVCSWCEAKNGEVHSFQVWCKAVGVDRTRIHDAMCEACYGETLEAQKLD